MTTTNDVVLRHGALDESELRGGSIIMRGVLDPDSLKYLRIGDYQREAAPLTSLSKLFAAIKNGEAIPDIELGMRGQKFTSRNDTFRLQNDVYIIDGLQRVSAAIHAMNVLPNPIIRLGATVHFATTEEWERDRFRILNTLRSPVSPNILLRNLRNESNVLLTLYGLSKNDKEFALNERVQWRQKMQRGELISALTMTKVCVLLHLHKGMGLSHRISELVPGLERTAERVGMQNIRENMVTFFNLVDECWGIRHIQYKETAMHMRGSFLMVLAEFLSDHTDFWQGAEEKKLFVSSDHRRKIKAFSFGDPEIARLASAHGKARELLYMLLRDHVNSGRRSHRLNPRDPEKRSLPPSKSAFCQDEDALEEISMRMATT